MNRWLRNPGLRDIALFTVSQLIVRWLETWLRGGSTERRDAWRRAAQATRQLHVEELGAATWSPNIPEGAARRRSRNPFLRRRKTSAEIIAAQVLGRRRNFWMPFR